MSIFNINLFRKLHTPIYFKYPIPRYLIDLIQIKYYDIEELNIHFVENLIF